jgi:hypothetical protein
VDLIALEDLSSAFYFTSPNSVDATLFGLVKELRLMRLRTATSYGGDYATALIVNCDGAGNEPVPPTIAVSE